MYPRQQRWKRGRMLCSACWAELLRGNLRAEHRLWRAKRHLKLLSCLRRSEFHEEPYCCCSSTKGEETLPSLCLLFPWAKWAWSAPYPQQTREKSTPLPLPVFSFILLLHQMPAIHGQVSPVPGVGRSVCVRRRAVQVRAASCPFIWGNLQTTKVVLNFACAYC